MTVPTKEQINYDELTRRSLTTLRFLVFFGICDIIATIVDHVSPGRFPAEPAVRIGFVVALILLLWVVWWRPRIISKRRVAMSTCERVWSIVSLAACVPPITESQEQREESVSKKEHVIEDDDENDEVVDESAAKQHQAIEVVAGET